jgi:hypothetical protein
MQVFYILFTYPFSPFISLMAESTAFFLNGRLRYPSGLIFFGRFFEASFQFLPGLIFSLPVQSESQNL